MQKTPSQGKAELMICDECGGLDGDHDKDCSAEDD